MSDIGYLIQEFQRAQTRANRMNRRSFRRARRFTRNQSRQHMQDIRQQGAEATANVNQSLINRGLYSTSLAGAERRRIGEQTQRSLGDARDMRARAMADLFGQRQAVGPDMGMLAGLAQQSAAADAQPDFWEGLLQQTAGGILGGIGGGLASGIGGAIEDLF